jgi:hypothetical protein
VLQQIGGFCNEDKKRAIVSEFPSDFEPVEGFLVFILFSSLTPLSDRGQMTGMQQPPGTSGTGRYFCGPHCYVAQQFGTGHPVVGLFRCLSLSYPIIFFGVQAGGAYGPRLVMMVVLWW